MSLAEERRPTSKPLPAAQDNFEKPNSSQQFTESGKNSW